MAAKYIYVESTLPVAKDGGSRVVISERDPKHPDGEVYVAGGPDAKPVKVGKTEMVLRKIAEGELREVTAAGKPKNVQVDEEPEGDEPEGDRG